MYYYKARIYSPTLGRFMQTDPIGYAKIRSISMPMWGMIRLDQDAILADAAFDERPSRFTNPYWITKFIDRLNRDERIVVPGQAQKLGFSSI